MRPSNPTAGHPHRGSQNWKSHVHPSVQQAGLPTTGKRNRWKFEEGDFAGGDRGSHRVSDNEGGTEAGTLPAHPGHLALAPDARGSRGSTGFVPERFPCRRPTATRSFPSGLSAKVSSSHGPFLAPRASTSALRSAQRVELKSRRSEAVRLRQLQNSSVVTACESLTAGWTWQTHRGRQTLHFAVSFVTRCQQVRKRGEAKQELRNEVSFINVSRAFHPF